MLDDRFLAKVTAYKGNIVIESVALNYVHPKWVPAEGGRIGCIVGDAENHLGVSEEALALLQKVKKGRVAIGDLMWFTANDGLSYFGWLGGSCFLVNAAAAEADRDYAVGKYVVIPNDVPEGARKAIDSAP